MMSQNATGPYENLQVYYGDIHSHCGLSYGNGSFEEALQNAQSQLDFVSVTLHAVWPDMPVDDEDLDYLVNYHEQGFSKAAKNWKSYLQKVDEVNQPGKFLVYPSYEWHSSHFGDHCIYYLNGNNQPILESQDLPTLRAQLRKLDTKSFIIPHHIGYKQGYRGINWEEFSETLSPVVEIFSFHGSSESSTGPYPYYHSMGPRHEQSCAQYGWSQGKIFGVVGSSDHHNAFPGSYGCGRMGVWAKTLTREAVWDSIDQRRTYALTGDRIQLEFSLNGCPMGALCAPSKDREINVKVIGGDAIDSIDVLHNNQVIHRECPLNKPGRESVFKVYLELGWGERNEDTQWEVDFQIQDGELIDIEPRFRGYGSQGTPDSNTYAYSTWALKGHNHVHFATRTRRNPSLHTPATEGMSFEIEGGPETIISLDVNGQKYEHSLVEILSGNRTHYLGGFVSPAICLHRAIPKSEYQHTFYFTHQTFSSQQDWYTIRVRQKNDQWAWSSPIWIKGN
jgi:hypothetical protein